MYGTNVEKCGRIIRSSKNLRALRDYARTSPIQRVELTPQGRVNGRIRVVYEDGATSSAHFASYHIMVDFVRNRRSWKTAEIVFYGENMGYLTKPGIIAGI